MFNPIPLFQRIQPADFIKAINDLIVEINANFQAIGFPPGTETVTLKQMKLALATTSSNHTVIIGIPANPDNPAYIQWTSGGTVTLGDPLSVVIQTALGYSTAQMLALFALAGQQTP